MAHHAPARSPRRRFASAVLPVLVALLWLSPAEAHFLLNTGIRVFIVEHMEGGLRVYLRLPMTLVVAGLRGPMPKEGLPAPPPYTFNRLEKGRVMHYLDLDAFRADPTGLARMVADGHRLVIGKSPVKPVIEAIRAYPMAKQPRFSNLAEAKAAFDNPLFPENAGLSYVGDTVLDVRLFYPAGKRVAAYALSSSLRPRLPGDENLADLLLDYAGGDPNIYRAVGLLEQPIEVDRSALTAARTFVVNGVKHILDGLDHVLFVICLTIGAVNLGNLLWRITGFTLGHTATLIAGFFGLVPAGAWFIPTIETAIAVTIIYAGAVAILRRAGAATFVVTALFGLLHGFGFSFMLHQVLQLDSPNLWVSLLSFNLGVEIGQAGLILAIWPFLLLVDRRWPRAGVYGRNAIAVPAIAVAALWTGQRVAILFQQAGA